MIAASDDDDDCDGIIILRGMCGKDDQKECAEGCFDGLLENDCER